MHRATAYTFLFVLALAYAAPALQQDAVLDDADPVEPVQDMTFNPVPVQHSVDNILRDPDTTQQSWLWHMLSGMGKRMQSLPSSREAPDHLARYQSLDGANSASGPDSASFINGAASNGRRAGDSAAVDEAVLKHLQELQTLGSAPVRDVKTDVSDPDQQWFLLDHDDDRAGPNALHTDALPNGGVAEIATNQAKLWRTVAQEETPLDLNALPRSSHHCVGSTDDHRVCRFYNLVMWNASLWYILEGPQQRVNGVPMEHNVSVPKLPLSWVMIKNFQEEVLNVNMTTRATIPIEDPSAFTVIHMKEALLWLLTYFDNYGHLLGEHGPTMHSMMCTWLGRCTYTDNDLQDVHLLFTNEDDMWEAVPGAVMEMFTCLSKEVPRTMYDPYFSDKVVIIHKSVAGIGPTCRGFPWCRPRYYRQPPLPHMMLSWKTRMMDCMGLPNSLTARADRPYLLFINRPKATGRAFLNLPEIVQHVRDKHPEFEVDVRYLEGMTMKQQAVLYHNASMLVQMHGAALGNMIFLPRGACIVDVVPLNNEDKHPWVIYMGQDYKPLYYNPVIIPPQKTHLMMEKINATKEWKMLSKRQKEMVMGGACPKQADRPEYDIYAACNFAWFLKRSNVELNVQHIESAIQQAIAVLNGNAQRIKFVSRRRRLLGFDEYVRALAAQETQDLVVNDLHAGQFTELLEPGHPPMVFR